MVHRFPLGLLGLALITGCSQAFILSNATPSFADGYRAGCESGASEGSNNRASEGSAGQVHGITAGQSHGLTEPGVVSTRSHAVCHLSF